MECEITKNIQRKLQNFFPWSIMVKGVIRSNRKRVIFRCINNVDWKQYQDILKCQLPKIYTTLYIFQQDGASIHNSASTKHFFRQKTIRCLENWPPQSPDLNIIEGLWSYLKDKVSEKQPKPQDDLWEVAKVSWNQISDETIRKLFCSMPHRIKAVADVRGGNTIH